MTIYLIILSLLIIFGFLDIIRLRKNQKAIFIFIIFIIFILQDGLRWETGTDWHFYRDFFFNSSKENLLAFEPGYVLINQIIYSISSSYTTFLIFIAFLIYFLYFKSITEYAVYPLITILFFYCSFIGYMGMNRQHIALAICLFSFRYIVSKEFWKFSLCVIIAALFHRTALIFFLTYFLNRSIPAYLFLLGLFIVYLLNPVVASLIKPFVSALPSTIAYKLNIYLKAEFTNSTFGTIMGTMKRALIFLPLYLYKDRLKELYPSIELMLNIYFLSLLIFVLFNNSVQVFVARGNLYFGTLFEIFLIPFFLVIVKKNFSQIIIYFLLMIFAVLTFFKTISVLYDLFVPYKGLFINFNYQRVFY